MIARRGPVRRDETVDPTTCWALIARLGVSRRRPIVVYRVSRKTGGSCVCDRNDRGRDWIGSGATGCPGRWITEFAPSSPVATGKPTLGVRSCDRDTSAVPRVSVIPATTPARRGPSRWPAVRSHFARAASPTTPQPRSGMTSRGNGEPVALSTYAPRTPAAVATAAPMVKSPDRVPLLVLASPCCIAHPDRAADLRSFIRFGPRLEHAERPWGRIAAATCPAEWHRQPTKRTTRTGAR